MPAQASDTAEIVIALRDLLTIAMVAMPTDLLAEDPRVARAGELLKRLQAAPPRGRVPSIPKRRSDDLDALLGGAVRVVGEADPGDPATADIVRATNAVPGPIAVDLEWDVRVALQRFIDERGAIEFSADTVQRIVREWLVTNGYLELDPPREEGH